MSENLIKYLMVFMVICAAFLLLCVIWKVVRFGLYKIVFPVILVLLCIYGIENVPLPVFLLVAAAAVICFFAG